MLASWRRARGFWQTVMAVLLLACYGMAQTPPAEDPWQAEIDAAEYDAIDDEYASALEHLRAAMKLVEAEGELSPRVLETRLRIAGTCRDADQCDEKDRPLAEKVLAGRKAVMAAHSVNAQTLDRWASLAVDAGFFNDALACNTDAQALREKRGGPKSAEAVEGRVRRVWLYHRADKAGEARREMNAILALVNPGEGKPTQPYLDALRESAELHDANSETGDAHLVFDRYLREMQRLHGSANAKVVREMLRVATWVSMDDDPAFAELLHKEAMLLAVQAEGARSTLSADAQNEWAGFLSQQKRWEEAATVYDNVLELRRSRNLRDAETVAVCRSAITPLEELGRYPDAIRLVREGMEIREQLPRDEDYQRQHSHDLTVLARLLAKDNKPEEAEAAFAEFAGLNRKDNSYWVGSVADTLAAAYETHGHLQLAATKLEDSLAIEETSPYSNKLERAKKMIRLSQIYQRMGRHEDAQRMSFASIQASMEGASDAGGDTLRNWVRNALLIGLLVVLLWAGLGAAGYTWAARRLDRKIDALFVPPAPELRPVDEEMATRLAALTEGDAAMERPPDAAEAASEEVAVATLAVAEETEESLFAMERTEEPPPAPEATEPAPEATEPAPEATEPAPVAPPPVPLLPLPVTQFRFTGDGSSIFEIRVRSLLFSLLTLGVYSFWGKAIVRRYLYSQLELEGDRLQFLGNGKELLLGWLKAVPVLAFLILFPNLLPLAWPTPHALWVGQLTVVAAVLLLWPVALAGAYRYRLNRMAWRAIRFSFRGSTWRYLGIHVLSYAWIVLSLGLYVPFFMVRKEKYLRRHTFFGDQPVDFDGKGKDLLWPFVFALPLMMITSWLFFPWYSALASRYYWAHTRFAGTRFRCTVDGWDLLSLWFGNFFLLVFTLGLASSWVTVRTLNFWTSRIHLYGVPELHRIRQDERTASAAGESFADYLGFDFGL